MNDISGFTVERADEIISNWRGREIAVLGDVMLDHYLWGTVERISPEAPVPVVEVDHEEYLLGGAANVALNLKKLGCKPFVVGVAGDDQPGAELLKICSLLGVDSSGVELDNYRPTTIKTRVIANNQQVVRADKEEKSEINGDMQKKLLSSIESKIGSISGLIISDYGKGVITGRLLDDLIALCRDNNLFVAVDPKDVHFKSYQRVSVITPNHHEAGFAFGMRIRDEETLVRVGRGLLNELNLDSILITRGPNGMALFLADGTYHLLPTVAQRVFDVTGAGDTVISSYTAAVTGGADPLEAAYLSNIAAGIVVGEIGTAQVTPETLRQSIRATIGDSE